MLASKLLVRLFVKPFSRLVVGVGCSLEIVCEAASEAAVRACRQAKWLTISGATATALKVGQDPAGAEKTRAGSHSIFFIKKPKSFF